MQLVDQPKFYSTINFQSTIHLYTYMIRPAPMMGFIVWMLKIKLV